MKNATFLDTNALLRIFLKDVPKQAEAARDLLLRVEASTETIWTSHLVIADLVWTLEGPPYRIARDEIASWTLRFVALPNFKVPRKHIFRRVFDLYTSHKIDYIDAYHAALLQSSGEKRLYSFDRHFDKVAGLARIEPQAGGRSS